MLTDHRGPVALFLAPVAVVSPRVPQLLPPATVPTATATRRLHSCLQAYWELLFATQSSFVHTKEFVEFLQVGHPLFLYA